ncbi:MAG: hypothetical protein R3F59_14550 [Myxococcota bacterium]
MSGADEAVWRGPDRSVRLLRPIPDAEPGLDLDGAVVLATGGARGVTAELLPVLLDAGATVVALGRSLPAAPPADREAAERAFYAEASAAEPRPP